MDSKVEIRRTTECEHGTFGMFLMNNIPLWLTLERKYLSNERNVSCIPKGEYVCNKIIHPKFGITFKFDTVPERDGILFHAGNFINDTEGCILIGKSFYLFNKRLGIAQSRQAMAEFRELFVNTQLFNIRIS